MKNKIVYKNKKAIYVKADDRFYAIVDPSTKNSLRLVTKWQLDVFNIVDDKKSLEDIAKITKIEQSQVIELFQYLQNANLVDFEKIPSSMASKRVNYLNLWIHMTDKCNLRCKYCYVSTLDTYKTMSLDVLEKIKEKLIDAVKRDNKLQMIYLKLSGGEIFSKFNYWKEIIREWKRDIEALGVRLEIVCLSNMTILNDEIIEYLKQMNISIGISLDGIGDFHDKNRVFINQKGTYESVINNIQKLEKEGIKFSISTTITNDSVEGLVGLTRFLIAKNYPFRFSNVKGDFIDTPKFTKFYTKAFAIMEMNIEKNFRFGNRYNQCDLTINSPDGKICGMGINGGAVYLDGSVYFCHTEFGKKEPLGSVFEDESLLKIIQRGDYYWDNSSQDCKSCPFELVCSGGCPIYRVNGKSPFCEFYQQNLPRVYQLLAKEKVLKENRRVKKREVVEEMV